MKLRNTTDIPNDLVKEIIRCVKPSGISRFDVMLKNSSGRYGGHAFVDGSYYHFSRAKFVSLRIGGKGFPFMLSPYQYGQHKGKKRWIANRTEMLVYLAAHELRHLWQSKTRNKSGYAWGSRGRYSEIDTEAYAIRKLREWRRTH